MQVERNQELMSGERISKPKRRKYRFSSEEARARCGVAGARNLAAYKATNPTPALTHGLSGLLNGGEPPQGSEAIQAEVDRTIDRLVEEKGGGDSLDAAQCALLAAIRTALLVIHLSKDLILKRGITTRRGVSRGILEVLNGYMNSLCRCVAAYRGQPEDEMPGITPPTAEEEAERIRELVGSADADAPLPTWVTIPQEPGLDVGEEPETVAELIEDSVEEVAAAEAVADKTVN
jgi:hypothetical protein